MWKNIAKRLTHMAARNVGLKLLALISSALLWLLVVNLDDPTQSRNFTATVNVINDEVLTDAGKYYELTNGNTVTFRVTARRSVIESISGSDFTATADMMQLEDDVRVPVEIEANRYSNQLSISSKTHYLTVKVGEISDSAFTVNADVTGEPGEGFEISEVTVTPNVINVQGPAELVSSIDKVKVSVDVSGRIDDVTDTQIPVFYDAAGNEIDSTSLTLSTKTVEVCVDLLSVQEVNISVETKGSLPEGLELDSITTDPPSIRVRGQSDVLNSLTMIVVTDVINLSDIYDDFETTIDISSYLPDGVTVANGVSSQVKIKVSVISESSKSFEIKTSNLTIQNMNPGMKGDFESETVNVVISGLESELSRLKADSITGSVDASGLEEGVHSVLVVLDLDEGLVAKTASTNIVLSLLRRPEDINDAEDSDKIEHKNTDSNTGDRKRNSESEGEDTFIIREKETGDTDVTPDRNANNGLSEADSAQEDKNQEKPTEDNGGGINTNERGEGTDSDGQSENKNN